MLSGEDEFIYREHGKYCTKICLQCARTITNWLFILNTGALSAMLALTKLYSICGSQFAILFFFLGLLAIYFSLIVEGKKFKKIGADLDSYASAYAHQKIDREKFYENIVPKVNQWPEFLEWASFTFFILGCFVFYFIVFPKI